MYVRLVYETISDSSRKPRMSRVQFFFASFNDTQADESRNIVEVSSNGYTEYNEVKGSTNMREEVKTRVKMRDTICRIKARARWDETQL